MLGVFLWLSKISCAILGILNGVILNDFLDLKSDLKYISNSLFFVLYFSFLGGTDISDLNVKVSKDGTTAQPLTMDGFAFLWGGVKGTHGAAKGKVGFEVKVHDDPSQTFKQEIQIILVS